MIGIIPLLFSPWVLGGLAAAALWFMQGKKAKQLGAQGIISGETLATPDALEGKILTPGYGDSVDVPFIGTDSDPRAYTTLIRWRNRGHMPITFQASLEFLADGSQTHTYDLGQLHLQPNSSQEVTYLVPLEWVPTYMYSANLEATLYARDGKTTWWEDGPRHFVLT